jgi:hypothetical protein
MLSQPNLGGIGDYSKRNVSFIIVVYQLPIGRFSGFWACLFVEVKFINEIYLMALSVCRSQLQVWDKWGGEL